MDSRRLKVLQFIAPSGFYGAEMWILALAKNLDRSDVDCQLAVTRESDRQNLELHRRFLALGLTGHQITMRGRFDPQAIRTLVHLLREERIDIIHTHGYKSDILGLVAARLAGVKAIATPHGFETIKDMKLQFFIRLGCLALRHFDRVVPLSRGLLEDVGRIGIRGSKVSLIVNGVDLSEVEEVRASAAPPLMVCRGNRVIGYVGRLSRGKNLDAMVRAFDLLRTQSPNTRLLIIGEGPHREELQSLASSLAAGASIEFLGYRGDRLRLMKELDVFTMTSSREGTPRCMMEAMALGCPVAAFDVPGVDDLVIHEKTGLLAPFGDEAGLAACWKRLIEDKVLGQRLGANGRAHVEIHFSARRMAEAYTSLYREVLARIIHDTTV